MQKVLVVEDDAVQLQLIRRILDKHSDQFETLTATDGKQAIDILKYTAISLVLTDIQMPKLNGMMLLAYVHTYHPDVPCIVMTAYGTSRLKERMPRDLLRFFHKPIDVKNLTHAVRAALKREQFQEATKGISVLNFLNLIDMERTSCILEIQSQGNPAGYMYFDKGALYDAECGTLTGEAAALELIAGEIQSYRFRSAPEKDPPRRIKTEVDVLIRNALGDQFLRTDDECVS